MWTNNRRTNTTKEEKFLVEHLQGIKTILDEHRYKCECNEDKPKDKNDLVNDTKDSSSTFDTHLFSSQKIVPIVLEEDEIKR